MTPFIPSFSVGDIYIHTGVVEHGVKIETDSRLSFRGAAVVIAFEKSWVEVPWLKLKLPSFRKPRIAVREAPLYTTMIDLVVVAMVGISG